MNRTVVVGGHSRHTDLAPPTPPSTLIWHLNLCNSQVEDAVSSGNIIDVAPLLPPFMDAQDHAVIIQRCQCVAKGKSTRAMANSFVGALPLSPSRFRPSPPSFSVSSSKRAQASRMPTCAVCVPAPRWWKRAERVLSCVRAACACLW